jgi:hypothetical protein
MINRILKYVFRVFFNLEFNLEREREGMIYHFKMRKNIVATKSIGNKICIYFFFV